MKKQSKKLSDDEIGQLAKFFEILEKLTKSKGALNGKLERLRCLPETVEGEKGSNKLPNSPHTNGINIRRRLYARTRTHDQRAKSRRLSRDY